jgi:hypothetical protein
MPTLQEVTLAHSRRLSDIARTREIRIAQAHAARDTSLRDLPATVKAYQKYDDELAAARSKHVVADAKAEAARHLALLSAIENRAERLDDAHAARRAADTSAMESRRKNDFAADRKYDSVMAGLREMPSADRNKIAQEAARARRTERESARVAHDDALEEAQLHYRGAVDRAMLAEYRESREGERAYLEALGLSEATAAGARTAADQDLADALSQIPEALEVLRSWRQQLATIVAESKSAEAEAFERFRLELESVKR